MAEAPDGSPATISRWPSKVGWPTSFWSDIPVKTTCTACSPRRSIGAPLPASVNGGDADVQMSRGRPGGFQRALAEGESDDVSPSRPEDLDAGQAIGRQEPGLCLHVARRGGRRSA